MCNYCSDWQTTLTLRTWSLAKTDETTTTYYVIRIIAKFGE